MLLLFILCGYYMQHNILFSLGDSTLMNIIVYDEKCKYKGHTKKSEVGHKCVIKL